MSRPEYILFFFVWDVLGTFGCVAYHHIKIRPGPYFGGYSP